MPITVRGKAASTIQAVDVDRIVSEALGIIEDLVADGRQVHKQALWIRDNKGSGDPRLGERMKVHSAGVEAFNDRWSRVIALAQRLPIEEQWRICTPLHQETEEIDIYGDQWHTEPPY